mgnify:CR=1 FL=1
MCGIIGYIGTEPAADIVLDALRRLEYRGYDSSGIATIDNGDLHVSRAVGKLKMLFTRIFERVYLIYPEPDVNFR